MDGTVIGRNCVITRAIIDKRVHIPPGTTIGVYPEADAQRYKVSDSGIVVLPREMRFE